MTQKDAILALLEERGSTGIHSWELFERGWPRAASAIHVLRREGHIIESEREVFAGGAEGVRYTLHAGELVPAGVGATTGLGASQSSPYDPYGDFS